MLRRHMLNQSTDLDRLFHALADPARRAIVERLTLGPAPVNRAGPTAADVVAFGHAAPGRVEGSGTGAFREGRPGAHLHNRAPGAQPGRAVDQRTADRVGATLRPPGRIP